MPRTSLLLVVAFVAGAAFAALIPPTGAGTQLTTVPCDGYREVPFQGPSCPTENGWTVLLPDGGTVETHGPDYADGSKLGGGAGAKSFAPVCVADPAAQFHAVVVYAYGSDQPDRSAEMTPLLRDVVDQANGFLRQEAMELGVANARYKMRCDASGAVAIMPAQMPRADAEVTFATLIADLRAQGYASPYAKYWVWYDGTRGDLYGQGQIYPNDRLSSSNGNARGNGFSVVWGLLEPMAFVHESSHTMGAVQRTAPHSSGNWHCVDGLDVMCYVDSSDSAYDPGACADRIRLDCGHDDYFHPDPEAGSYLATHWNMGGRLNRFLEMGRPNGAPEIEPVACAPPVVDFDQPVVCRLIANDDSDGIAYWVSLDGGPLQRQPATGWRIAGDPLILTGSWPDPGEHTWRVVAFDDAKKSLSSVAATATVRVGCVLERGGNLTAGVAGMPEDTAVAQEAGIPRACGDASYRLTGSPGSDIDVCWMDGIGVSLGCETKVGDEAGRVPQGARSATVYLKAGAAATYALKAD